MKKSGPSMGHPRRTVNRPSPALNRRLRTAAVNARDPFSLDVDSSTSQNRKREPTGRVQGRPTSQDFLIVDDDRDVTDTFVRMLRLEGFTVYSALNAKSGLELAAAKHPDAIILDLRMPILSGLHFLQRLRSRPRLRHIPVAIVTGDYFVEADVTTELKDLGALLRFKPIWLDDLVTLARGLAAS